VCVFVCVCSVRNLSTGCALYSCITKGLVDLFFLWRLSERDHVDRSIDRSIERDRERQRERETERERDRERERDLVSAASAVKEKHMFVRRSYSYSITEV
jgi:hypothetical protein